MVEDGGGGQKAERVSRAASRVVGAVVGGGGGAEESNLLIDQRTMLCSLAALEKIRSPHHATLWRVLARDNKVDGMEWKGKTWVGSSPVDYVGVDLGC